MAIRTVKSFLSKIPSVVSGWCWCAWACLYIYIYIYCVCALVYDM